MQKREPAPEPDTVALEALNELFEAALGNMGNKAARGFLRSLAARLAARAPSNVVGINDAPGARPSTAHAWLQDRLSVWLSRYG